MTDSEKKLLMALVAMVHQHLHAYGDEVDNLAESAGERAIQVLSDFGLMEMMNPQNGISQRSSPFSHLAMVSPPRADHPRIVE